MNEHEPIPVFSDFPDRMLATLNAGALCLMLSIGHRTGLFDAIDDGVERTTAEMAEAAGLDERYVREWANALVTGDVLEHDPRTGRYRLPAERAAFLTRAAGADNVARGAQFVALLGSVEDDVVRCFQRGGGVPYTRFPRFHAVMAEESAETVLPALEPLILPLVPGLVDRLRRGIRVLDLGCGRGQALQRLAAAFPASRFEGRDLSEEVVGWANDRAASAGLANLRFVAEDLSEFQRTALPGSFDLVTTFDAIHDQKEPANLLAGIARTLAADGVYLAQDIKGSSHVHRNVGQPLAPFLYTISCMHCMTVSLAQGGKGLGAMWGRELAETMLREAGFGSVEVHELPHDLINYYYVCRL